MKLNGKILLTGQGLHSGKNCELLIEPYDTPEILLCSGENELPITKFMLNGTNRGSDYIFPDGMRIRTCEHVLSALTGLGIFSGVKLTVDGGEMPALDGCAKKVCDEILAHSDKNAVEFSALDGHAEKIFADKSDDSEAITITEPVIISTDDKTRFIAAFPSDDLHITYAVEYKFIGAQIIDYVHSPEKYYEEIASARTFAMKSDIDYLRSHGMAMGGSLENAIVVSETIQASGGLHWTDEFVRHKVLDLLGDLASLGKSLHAHVIAMRAGHELHLKLAEKIKSLHSKGE